MVQHEGLWFTNIERGSYLLKSWYLKRNVLQIETERVTAILLSILILVLISEIISAWARDRVMRMK
jgi:ABC-type phosphate/phosphonate transport system permease subunit